MFHSILFYLHIFWQYCTIHFKKDANNYIFKRFHNFKKNKISVGRPPWCHGMHPILSVHRDVVLWKVSKWIILVLCRACDISHAAEAVMAGACCGGGGGSSIEGPICIPSSSSQWCMSTSLSSFPVRVEFVFLARIVYCTICSRICIVIVGTVSCGNCKSCTMEWAIWIGERRSLAWSHRKSSWYRMGGLQLLLSRLGNSIRNWIGISVAVLL